MQAHIAILALLKAKLLVLSANVGQGATLTRAAAAVHRAGILMAASASKRVTAVRRAAQTAATAFARQIIRVGEDIFREGNRLIWRVAARLRSWVTGARSRVWRVGMSEILVKRSSEALLYDVDCSALLGADEKIVGTPTLTSTPTDLVFGPILVDEAGKVIQVKISGGRSGQNGRANLYTLRFLFATNATGDLHEATVVLAVEDRALTQC